jgi:hypothetical protein
MAGRGDSPERGAQRRWRNRFRRGEQFSGGQRGQEVFRGGLPFVASEWKSGEGLKLVRVRGKEPTKGAAPA